MTLVEALTQTLIQKLKYLDVNFSFLKWQGHNGASAMNRQYKGCTTIIKKNYPDPLYVHFSNHALNLALSYAASYQQSETVYPQCKKL